MKKMIYIGRDGDTYYNCTIGSFLLLMYHPYPPSFHEMIFILVYIMCVIFRDDAKFYIRILICIRLD